MKDKIITAAFIALLCSGCESKNIADYSSMKDFSYHSSIELGQNQNKMLLTQYYTASLASLSQGQLSHEWIVPSESGIYFLDNKYVAPDVDTDSEEYDVTGQYDHMLIDLPYTNSEDVIHLYFTEPGYYTVKIRDTFSEEVTYYTTDTYQNLATAAHHSVYEDGVHVIETDVNYRVYSAYLNPVAEVYLIDNGVRGEQVEIGLDESGKPAEITLEYGEKLLFVDASSEHDGVNSRAWSCTNLGFNGTAEEATIQFAPDELGSFQISLTTTRNAQTGVNGGTETLEVPLIVNVVNSTEPLQVSSSQIDNENIAINLANGAFDEDSIVDAAQYFSVDYSNGAANGTIAVSEVILKSSNVIYLQLSESIYNTDLLTVNYTGGDAIKVTNNSYKFAMDSAASTVATTLKEIFVYDFEDASQLDDWSIKTDLFEFFALPDSEPQILNSDGNNYISITPDVQTYSLYSANFICDQPFTGNKANFTLKADMRVTENAANINITFPTQIANNSFDNKDWAGNWLVNFADASAFPINTWVEFSSTVTTLQYSSGIYLNFDLGGIQRGTIDMDNISLSNVEQRPGSGIE